MPRDAPGHWLSVACAGTAPPPSTPCSHPPTHPPTLLAGAQQGAAVPGSRRHLRQRDQDGEGDAERDGGAAPAGVAGGGARGKGGGGLAGRGQRAACSPSCCRSGKEAARDQEGREWLPLRYGIAMAGAAADGAAPLPPRLQVYDLGEGDTLEVGPFRGTGIDLRGTQLSAVYRWAPRAAGRRGALPAGVRRRCGGRGASWWGGCCAAVQPLARCPLASQGSPERCGSAAARQGVPLACVCVGGGGQQAR
jgi:hypothetical protein